MNKKNVRRQINIRLEKELHDFLAEYAESNFMTVTGIIRGLIADLYKESKRPPLVVEGDKR